MALAYRTPQRILRPPDAVMGAMATDFRDGKTFPRRGRDAFGDTLWLKRVIDKARANAAGTIHDYIYPCPMDQGVMERWGITPQQFDEAIVRLRTDDDVHAWLRERTTPEKIERANRWLLDEKSENLNRQDAEEGAAASA